MFDREFEKARRAWRNNQERFGLPAVKAFRKAAHAYALCGTPETSRIMVVRVMLAEIVTLESEKDRFWLSQEIQALL